jgi:ribosomal protein S5
MLKRSASCRVQVGHITSTLRKLEKPVPRWLEHVDQAPARNSVRTEKDKYLREIMREKGMIGGLFGPNERTALSSAKPSLGAEGVEVSNISEEDEQKKISDALKMYRILQGPNALPFYKQDAILSMHAKLNQVMNEHGGQGKETTFDKSIGDPLQLQLPVVNPKSFIIALNAAVGSLSDDLELICTEILGIEKSSLPEESHPERFLMLVKSVFGAFPLRKDPAAVDQFMIDHWKQIGNFLQPLGVSEQDFSDWLRGHLERVTANQRRVAPSLAGNEMYSLSVDFPYDQFMNPKSIGRLSLRQKMTLWDSSQAGIQMERVLSMMKAFGGDIESIKSVSNQFQEFVYDCEKLGLKKWFGMDEDEFERSLPRGPALVNLSPSEADISTAKLMLKCAARGKGNLLDFDAIDPVKLLTGMPTKSVEDEMTMFPENESLRDSEIDSLINVEAAGEKMRSQQPVPDKSEITDLEKVLESEKQFVRTAGPAEWENGDWKWKKPSAAMFDTRLGKYVRNQSLVDPNLNLSSFRQYTCDVRRMCSMSSAGRVYYARSIVVVGNGQGIYGFGVGFGNTPRESNADAAVKALRNLRYVDFDPMRTLVTPVRGTEYKARLFLRPLRQGKKLRCGRRFLPLFYILGLHNVRARFNHTRWYPRINAVIRTLDQIQSRRTLANATGKRYADIMAPGDHWVHWPDRWFDVVRRTYQSKEKRIKAERRRVLHSKTRGHVVASPLEVKPGWTKHAWMNPLAKYQREKGKTRTIARSVKQVPVSDHFPAREAIPGDENNLVQIES